MIIFDTPRKVAIPTLLHRECLTAHVISDLLDPEAARAELLAFATKIGHKHEWLQNPGKNTEHFDLIGVKTMEKARRAGATEVPARELGRVLFAKRGPIPCTTTPLAEDSVMQAKAGVRS